MFEDDSAVGAGLLSSRCPMPIRPEHRFFYLIDWRELSAVIRFGWARGRCEGYGRPHGRLVYHLGDGRWWDAEAGRWRDGRGRRIRLAPGLDVLAIVRTTRVFLAAAHRNHDTADNIAVAKESRQPVSPIAPAPPPCQRGLHPADAPWRRSKPCRLGSDRSGNSRAGAGKSLPHSAHTPPGEGRTKIVQIQRRA